LTVAILVMHFSATGKVQASAGFTAEEVALHDKPSDCYMIFENRVYDISEDRLDFHALKYMDIDKWCGKDMTADFKDKAGRGQDHIPSSYTLLESYYVGDLQDISEENSDRVTKSQVYNPYNIPIPVIFVILLYATTQFLSRKKNNNGQPLLSPQRYKFLWNTFSLLTLIPSAVFGIYMVMRKQFPDLLNLNFNFLYWHVEGGILLVCSVTIHIIERLRIYFAQGKSSRTIAQNKPE